MSHPSSDPISDKDVFMAIEDMKGGPVREGNVGWDWSSPTIFSQLMLRVLEVVALPWFHSASKEELGHLLV